MYLNLVHNDTVLTPLNKKRELSDKKNDRDWMIIPIAFDGPKKRKNFENKECWHWDGHIATCVVDRMKTDTRVF